MEEQKKFSKSMFGFKKADVNNYIMSLSQQFSAQIEDLTKKNSELAKQNAELSKRVEELETERALISDTLLKAKRQAEEIIADAEVEARRRLEELEAELVSTRKAIDEETQKLLALRDGAKTALSQYIENLEEELEV